MQVFARTSPEQKEVILKTLRAVGYTTLMCGDGTNDVGALKAHHRSRPKPCPSCDLLSRMPLRIPISPSPLNIKIQPGKFMGAQASDRLTSAPSCRRLMWAWPCWRPPRARPASPSSPQRMQRRRRRLGGR